MDIRIDDLTGPEIAGLLQEHLDEMALHSPDEGRFALDLSGLRVPEITFWSVWDGDQVVGCGALKQLDPEHGEVKSMRVTYSHRGRGISRGIMEYILDEAQKRNYRRLSLETGSMDAFKAAHRLYESFGFEYCGPFGDYKESPYNIFMTKLIG